MDEREKILQMLKDGIISVSEALTLLDTISTQPKEKESQPFISEEAKEKLREKIRLYNLKLEDLGENINEHVKEIIRKVETKLNEKKEYKHE